MSTGPEDDDGDVIVQKVVPAASVQPLHSTAASSVFNWRRPSAEPSDISQEEPLMTKQSRTHKAKPVQGDAPATQPQILMALASQARGLSREELRQAVKSMSDNQFSNAIYNACKSKRVRRNGDLFEITKAVAADNAVLATQRAVTTAKQAATHNTFAPASVAVQAAVAAGAAAVEAAAAATDAVVAAAKAAACENEKTAHDALKQTIAKAEADAKRAMADALEAIKLAYAAAEELIAKVK